MPGSISTYFREQITNTTGSSSTGGLRRSLHPQSEYTLARSPRLPMRKRSTHADTKMYEVTVQWRQRKELIYPLGFFRGQARHLLCRTLHSTGRSKWNSPAAHQVVGPTARQAPARYFKMAPGKTSAKISPRLIVPSGFFISQRTSAYPVKTSRLPAIASAWFTQPYWRAAAARRSLPVW